MAEVSSQTLHIVARELTNELNEARAALEAFGDQQENVALLRKCNEHLHSVHGALRVAEVYGAALLAEEMGQVARYLIENFAEKRHLAEGLDALMRAMVQLPTYLERVLSGGRDMALVLLPLLNDLRAVRGHALLSEGTLLLLNLSSDQQASPKTQGSAEASLSVTQWARKLRTRFQLGLLGWIKGERVEQNLELLSRAAEKLEQVATSQPVFQLWWVVGALLEALRDGGLEGSASVKRLLGQADREMKRLYEQGEGRYAEAPALELLNNLLYYIARATTSGPRVAAVRASFRLSELLPVDEGVEQARESLSAPSVKLMKTVAAAIKEDLSRVKDALDIFVRQGGTHTEELVPQLELLKKIGDTLGVLGLGELRDKVQTETQDLQGIVNKGVAANENSLLRMAATLIKVEDSLDEQLIGMIVPSAAESASDAPARPAGPEDIEFRQVTEAVLRECVVNMARIKEAIALSVEKPSEAQAIDQIPQLLNGIAAGLLMLGKNRAVEVIQGIGNALRQFVRSDGMTLPQEAVDRFADAIVAVEYYMETLQAGRADPWYMLDNAETCLRFLSETRPIPRIEGVPASEHAHTIVIEPLSQTIASPTEHERTAVLSPAVIQSQAPAAAKAPVPPKQVAQPARVSAAADRPIDPEFLELFIEEAKDEIAKLNALFPRWDENPQDQDALVNVRRSFHTLKGSGRMVGAQRIGDFAWSVENLLNRVLNKTLERTPDMVGMLRDAVAAVPELVEQLETGREPRVDVDRIIAQANAIAGVRPAQSAPAPSSASPSASATPVKPAPRPSAPAPANSPPHAAPVAQKKTTAEPPMDAALHEIYSKETAGHLATIREFIAACELANPPYPVTEDLYRSCHTLSGTAKTAGARQGIKIAEPLNRYVRKLYDNSIGISANGLAAIRDAVAAIQQVVDHITEDTGFFINHGYIIGRLNDLEHAIDVEISRLAETLDMSSTRTDTDVSDQRSATIETLAVTGMFTAEELAPPPQAAAHDEHAEDVIELEPTDANAFDMMHWSFDNFPTDSAIGEATIKIDDELEPVESHEIILEPSLDEPTNVQPVLRADETMNAEALEGQIPESEEIVIEELDAPDLAASGLHPVNDPIVVETAAWAAEFEPQVLPTDTTVASDEQVTLQSSPLVDDMQSTQQVPELSMLDAQPEHVIDLDAGLDLQPLLESEVPVQADAIEAEQELEAEAALDDDSDLADFGISEPSANDRADAVAPATPTHVETPKASPAAVVATMRTEETSAAHAEPEPKGDEDFDPEVAAIFTDEATELLETADQSLSAWIRDRANNALVFELKRVVHTLKGGARMAGLRAMGDLSHELETLMQHVENGTVPADQEVFDSLQASLDELHRMRDIVASGNRCAPARDLIHRIRALCGLTARVPALQIPTAAPAPAPSPTLHVEAADDEVEVEIDDASDFGSQTNVVPMLTEEHEVDIDVEFGADELGAAAPREAVRVEEKPQKEPTGVHAAVDVASLQPELAPDESGDAAAEFAPPVLPPGREPVAQERQEFARVDADLLDNLLNNAGEVSIFRSRLEQQVTSIEFNLAELGRTVTRLRDQLRKLELETEAQILHRHEEEHPGRADFDPLELDRYSSIQQLSRAFAESVSDVGSIEGLLENLTREAQNLLLQQSRVVTELQNGLMRTRMVPFQRHVQRLSRLVRQVATDTGKRAELVVIGASGELDRQVLERMLPPFEHMLRNSVVHGIETPQERLARGKPENGTIKVGLHREGSEMVIVLEDDGRGIDVNAVREKAKQRGLIQSGKVLSDEEALQLILEPGFSTATTITQHAGRGVGMDVVVNEIKKLGGALFTESEFGKGVKFTIRLPFTLAITQALIVRTGDELYALPLPSVEGVSRVQRSEVERHLAEETPSFSYGGQIYRFQHLGAYIGGVPSVLPETDIAVPVILIRAGEHSTAIVMDELVGTREMVVKSVGPQIATIRGISGATILGDGRIVIILDMGALVRSEWRGREQMAQQGPKEDRRTFALVVDDSITVRRVTQRLLERHGMRVMTAKDGIDALSVLQEHLPDVILLDIEMPRMDGYEFATQVRADARTADIPIVMITSRVGEKHRARAIEIGVNDYLGKPYQENQLLDAIEPLVQARRRKVS